MATALAPGGAESAYSNEVSYLSAPPPPETIWPEVAVPIRADAGADAPVELGVRFISDVWVKIVGITFYKSAANTGIHVANLWNSLGNQTGECDLHGRDCERLAGSALRGSGGGYWGTSHTASYYCPNGHYAADWDFFLNQGGGRWGRCMRRLTSEGFTAMVWPLLSPDQVYRNTNYSVDVMFVQ